MRQAVALCTHLSEKFSLSVLDFVQQGGSTSPIALLTLMTGVKPEGVRSPAATGHEAYELLPSIIQKRSAIP